MRGRALTLVAIASVLAAAGAPLHAANLLANGSFDRGLEGWTAVPTSPPLCVQMAWQNGGFVQISASCTNVPTALGWQQSVAVMPQQSYVLSFRASSNNLAGDAGVQLTFRSAQGAVIWRTDAELFCANQPWDDFTWAFRAPHGSTSVEVVAGVRHPNQGWAAFDDIVLAPVMSAGPRRLSVDLSRPIGTIRQIAQTNRGPILEMRESGTVDFGPQMAKAGITLVRTHDYHYAFDMHVVFPNPSADPELASSYDFSTTDAAIRQMLAQGFVPFFRLGESWDEVPSPRMSTEKWARVAVHVVMHVNDGWAGGLHASVRYWEIWNEPNGKKFWNDTPEAFYALFAATAKALKAHDPTLVVGGPGLAGFAHTDWIQGLLRHLKKAAAPIDFFSWHVYHMGNPHTLARAQRLVRGVLDAEGFTATQAMNTEWNLNPGTSCAAVGCSPYVLSAYNGAHLAAALTYLQDTDIPLAFRYRTDGYGMFGLFGDGRVDPLYSPSGLAQLLWAGFLETPTRVAADGGDQAGFTLLAGRNDSTGVAHVLIANPGSADTGWQLALAGLPAHFRWRVEEVSDAHLCSLASCAPYVVAGGTEADLADGVLSQPMAAPTVHRVRIEPTAASHTRRRLR
jgi:hypothetical protein